MEFLTSTGVTRKPVALLKEYFGTPSEVPCSDLNGNTEGYDATGIKGFSQELRKLSKDDRAEMALGAADALGYTLKE